MKRKGSPQNHYKVLALSDPLATNKDISQCDIKSAYRSALLRNHPDKAEGVNKSIIETPTYTIDEITLAFKILGDPASRSRYDQKFKNSFEESQVAERFHTGLDTVDLDDLISSEDQGIWYRHCRCGNEQGFMVTEGELESNAEHGEVITGCRGCSLWLRVTFALSEDG